MKKHILIPVTLISIMLFSCGGRSYEGDSSSNFIGLAKEAALAEATESPAYEEEFNNADDARVTKDIPVDKIQPIDRKLIKEGSISFETDNCKSTKKLIEQSAKKLNAYLSNDNEYSYGDRIQHSVTVRIPADNFDAFMEQISQSILELDDQNISVRDVTEEFVDVEARLIAKKKVEQRYIELLDKAYSVGDILQIENELARLREQIEATEGRLRYLKNQVSLSTITITYYQVTEEGFGFSRKVNKGFENGWKGLLWFFIGLVNIWPFILIITVGVWLLVRWIRRKTKK